MSKKVTEQKRRNTRQLHLTSEVDALSTRCFGLYIQTTGDGCSFREFANKALKRGIEVIADEMELKGN
jgi:hypothetical protein